MVVWWSYVWRTVVYGAVGGFILGAVAGGIAGATGEVITRYRYTYPGKDPLELIFFRVRHFSGEPQNLIFHDLRWQPKFQLANLDFVEGDREFIHGIYTSAYGNHD